MGNNVMVRVRTNLCVGCGLCTENCAAGAISVVSRKARINQALCTGCGVCIDTCPQEAIVEFVPVSSGELLASVGSLQQKTDDILERIERIRYQKS